MNVRHVLTITAGCAALFAGAAFGASQGQQAGAAGGGQLREIAKNVKAIERDVDRIDRATTFAGTTPVAELALDGMQAAEYSCRNTYDLLQEHGRFGGYSCAD